MVDELVLGKHPQSLIKNTTRLLLITACKNLQYLRNSANKKMNINKLKLLAHIIIFAIMQVFLKKSTVAKVTVEFNLSK